MSKESSGLNKKKVLAVMFTAVVLLTIVAAYKSYAMPSTWNPISEQQSITPTPSTNPESSSNKPDSNIEIIQPTLTLTPSLIPSPSPTEANLLPPFPGYHPCVPLCILSLSISPVTAHINEEIFGYITTNIPINATVTYTNSQSGEAKQIIIPCNSTTEKFTVVLAQAGSYTFIAESKNHFGSNIVQVNVS
jgi:hypothetical protein